MEKIRKTENNLQRTEPKSLILFNLQFALTNLVLIRGVGQLQQVLSPLLVFCAVLGLPLELRLHQPLLALGVGARLQERRRWVVLGWSREAVAGVDVLNCEILKIFDC